MPTVLGKVTIAWRRRETTLVSTGRATVFYLPRHFSIDPGVTGVDTHLETDG